MLNVASAIPFHQTIVNFAIDLVLERKCDEGLIKYNYRYEYNKARNCKHIELIKNDMLITFLSVTAFGIENLQLIILLC